MPLKKRLERLERREPFTEESQRSAQVRKYTVALTAYFERRTEASKEFCLLHDREPIEGDVLAYEEIENTTGVDWLDWDLYIDRGTGIEPLSEGQEKQRDGYRLKVEGGSIYRTLTSQEKLNLEHGNWPTLWVPIQDSEWWISTLCDPEERWRDVEEEALGIALGWYHPVAIPTMPAVVFLGVVDGKHKCRPATEEELQRAAVPTRGKKLGALNKTANVLRGRQHQRRRPL